jgi:hypothetical protein
MNRLGLWVMILILLLAGCGSDGSGVMVETPPAEPAALLQDAASRIRAARTFRLEVLHSGAPHFLNVHAGGPSVQVEFRRAQMQYVADDEMDGQMSVMSPIGRIDLEAYTRGDEQWYRLRGSIDWIQEIFADGFNARALVAEDAGFQVGMTALRELEYLGRVKLDDGTHAHQIAGITDGANATALLVGLVAIEAESRITFYIDVQTGYPARFVIRQMEPTTDDEPEPTTWTVDVYDINDEPDLIKPDDG